MAKKKTKRRRKPRKRATTEKQVREMIARNERLLERWLAKLTTATRQVNKHSKKVAYYNARLEAMSTAREFKERLRSIDLEDLDQ